MPVRWESTQVDGREMRVYLGVPDRPGPHPGIVVAQHGSGVDAQIQDAVHRLHREGYAAAAPELFHRQPAQVEGSRVELLRDDEVIADINATVAHLAALRVTVAPLGIMGTCTTMRATPSRTSPAPNATASGQCALPGPRCWRFSPGI